MQPQRLSIDQILATARSFSQVINRMYHRIAFTPHLAHIIEYIVGKYILGSLMIKFQPQRYKRLALAGLKCFEWKAKAFTQTDQGAPVPNQDCSPFQGPSCGSELKMKSDRAESDKTVPNRLDERISSIWNKPIASQLVIRYIWVLHVLSKPLIAGTLHTEA